MTYNKWMVLVAVAIVGIAFATLGGSSEPTSSAETPPTGWGSSQVRATILSAEYPNATLKIETILDEEPARFNVPRLQAGDTLPVNRMFLPIPVRLTAADTAEEDRERTLKAFSLMAGKHVIAVLTFCREEEYPTASACDYGTGWTAFIKD